MIIARKISIASTSKYCLCKFYEEGGGLSPLRKDFIPHTLCFQAFCNLTTLQGTKVRMIS